MASALELEPEGDMLVIRAAEGWKPGSIDQKVPARRNSLAGLTLMADKPLILEDIETETRFVPSPMLREHKVRSGITVVIPGHPRPFGTLGAYSTKLHIFDDEQVRFMQSVAFVLATAIDRRRAEAALTQSQRLESLGQLTGGIAHDFNNLLTVVIGQSELLVDDLKQDPMHAQMAQTIGIAAKRAAELTAQLLAFARGQALQPTDLDVNQLIGESDSLLRRALGGNAEVRFALADKLPACRADGSQVVASIMNLAINARDAMPQGGVLTVETAKVELDRAYSAANRDVAPGSYVMISVSDTGQGMTPDVLARVFEPFFTTKPVDQGTGLGLSMVYGFAKQSGGHVKIYSELGHGTTVKLYLPVADQEAAGAGVGGDAQIRIKVPPAKGEAILLVEDEDMVRGFAAAQLVRLGYRVLEAKNGPEALDRMRAGAEIDLLFSDIVMPGGMSGLQLADEALRLRPALRVLFTSGYPGAALSAGPVKLGAGAALLHKPYTVADLALQIRTALDKKK